MAGKYENKIRISDIIGTATLVIVSIYSFYLTRDVIWLEFMSGFFIVIFLIKKLRGNISASIIDQGWGPLPLEQPDRLVKNANLGFFKRMTLTAIDEVSPHLKIGETILAVGRAEVTRRGYPSIYLTGVATSQKRLMIFDEAEQDSKGFKYGRIYSPALGDRIIKIEKSQGFVQTKNITIRLNNGQEITFRFASSTSTFFDALATW